MESVERVSDENKKLADLLSRIKRMEMKELEESDGQNDWVVADEALSSKYGCRNLQRLAPI